MFPQDAVYYQNGWPGAVGYPIPGPASRGCGCGVPPFPPVPQCPGPVFRLDSSDVFYHLYNNQLSNLINLQIPNGTPLQTIFDTIDSYLGQINVSTWTIPNLKAIFPSLSFTNLKVFGQAVDTEFGTLIAAINQISGTTAITSTNTESFHWNLTGPGNRNLSGNVQVSEDVGNLLSVVTDGLVVPPQTLSVNYSTNQLSISGGNGVTLPNAPAGFLGNVSADPGTAVDGNYWYNTTVSELKIRLNGAVRVITIT